MALVTGILLVPVSCLKEMPRSEKDLPQSLQWNPDLAFPLGNDSLGLNEGSGFNDALWELNADSIPVWIDQGTVEMSRSIPFDLASLSQDIDHVNGVLFRLNLYNGFPHEVITQAYFVDLEQNRIDSMFGEGPETVNPGGIVGIGETVDPSYLRRDVTFSKDRIELLGQATEILVNAWITGYADDIDTALIDFYRSYQFDVDVGIMVSIILDL